MAANWQLMDIADTDAEDGSSQLLGHRPPQLGPGPHLALGGSNPQPPSDLRSVVFPVQLGQGAGDGPLIGVLDERRKRPDLRMVELTVQCPSICWIATRSTPRRSCGSRTVVGEQWSLLVLRDALFGQRRFDEFVDTSEIEAALAKMRAWHEKNAHAHKPVGEPLESVLFILAKPGAPEWVPTEVLALAIGRIGPDTDAEEKRKAAEQLGKELNLQTGLKSEQLPRPVDAKRRRGYRTADLVEAGRRLSEAA